VAESTNVVNIINQQNNLTLDNKDKLGEWMANYTFFTQNGSVSAFYLPYFQKQRFIDANYVGGVKISQTRFEDKNQPAFALRWQNTFDDLDLGLSYFKGTDRQAVFTQSASGADVYYPKVQQVGLDAQLTQESILWKLEYAQQDYTATHEYALVYGFEYLTAGDWSVNYLLEHTKNSRKNKVLQNDLLLGVRLDFNAESGAEALVTLVHDLDYQSNIVSIRGSRRLNNNLKIQLEGKYIQAKSSDKILQNAKDDDSLNLTLSYYF
jgi:hypothetical protein